jgi:hypothetical protein
MSDLLKLKFDLGPLTQLEEKMRTSLSDILREEGENLAMQSHAHVLELAAAELHTRREKFVKGLKFDQVSQHTWMIVVPSEIVWIEDGLPENYEMLDHLLKSPKAKIAKDGSRYVIVPFEKNNGKTDNTDYGREMRVIIQKELARRKIPFDRIERNEDGSAKLGLLHQVVIPDSVHPLKTDSAPGPGKGKGPVGQPKQGRTGVPFLSGLRIYQRMAQDGFGRPRVNRHIMTFRVASSKQDRGSDWVHPGSAPMKFLDRTYDWAVKEWEDKIKPQILKRLTE